MDPVLKAGLPKLFVLAVLQTIATYTVTVCKEGKKYRTFYGKSTDKKSKLSRKKRANITKLEKEKSPFTQQNEGRGKERKKKGSEVGEETERCVRV